MSARTPVIVGIGLSDYPRAPHLSALGHVQQATHRALRDCGLTIGDVDGLLTTGSQGPLYDDVVSAAEYLGVRARYLNGTMTGGSAFEFMISDAAAAVERGACETAVIAYGSELLSNPNLALSSASLRNGRHSGIMMWDSLYGQSIVGAYAMIAQRHMHDYGTTAEQLAEIAVASRAFAQFNPLAMVRTPLTIAAVLKSRMVADPLRAADCCVVSDGGGALVITTLERARDLCRRPFVFLAGAGGAMGHFGINQMDDFSTTPATLAAHDAFAQAGVRPCDIDTVQIYDSFTITVLMMLEGMGFCERGGGGPFVAGGRLGPGGALPCHTDGGALSSCHPGMRGIFLLIEAVRQLRGEGGEAQTRNAKLAAVCGSGGIMSCVGVAILSGDQP